MKSFTLQTAVVLRFTPMPIFAPHATNIVRLSKIVQTLIVQKLFTLNLALTFTGLADKLYKQGEIKMSSNNCVVYPRKNVWVVSDLQGNKIGEVGAMTEIEARQKVADHVIIPFTLSHIEE